MEKLNKYAPIILIFCALMILGLQRYTNTTDFKSYIAYGFLAMGGFLLFAKQRK